MFIHLGGDLVVSKDEVIAILNTQLMKKTEVNREFMQLAEDEGFISSIGNKARAKSLCITTKQIYLSPISSVTLKKRADDLWPTNEKEDNGEPW